ncbi:MULTISPECIES: esterase-like activity of phytase family protein [Rhizobium]|uniref:esterase-like activity of phytase family protein n=1 Tax=Rhizobium TaxID=379 RepID=UPI001B3200B7|nr:MULTISPECIES: esterase-like activity of phytase family protein [Rhizobium]MBX4911121.1 esterase-like activity of phytase family protein [Rhizobium bangladeshense]MBX5216885.1 esterase-like activity of phytase family protein [Rhizobium sp. NLR9a]MBX5235174.1 esterase-like activity of phytase family protein [Rhizobium sp. NLR4a]MBX5247373.1 esterase-like activity of phytase family protein [Rhizobium sp. NLR3b]MBX5254125.1 esterase-like activity of phytase family protein [Rhizobium sp. NLR4b]
MKNVLFASVSLFILIAGPVSADQQQFPAKLTGQAILPANTMVPAPADAPEFLKHSGKFTTPDRKRSEALGAVPGKDGARVTDLKLPFDGQPIQGFSGIKTMADGTFWTLSDNGFGSKANSSDSMLFLHQMKFDWTANKAEVVKNLFLSDPNKIAPFPLVLEGTEKRYLTGADFDIESIQPDADGFWLGDEFGPYLLKVDTEGRLTDVIPTMLDGKPVLSPDNPLIQLPGNPAAKMPVFNLKRSGGFEGLAMSKDGSKLYGLLEGAIYEDDGTMETADGHTAIRVIEFDAGSKKWTGRSWLYPFEDKGVSIGDFNMLDDSTALVIERDSGAGTSDKACSDPKQPKPDCFEAPAVLKRVYKIEFNDANLGKAVRKIGYIDLLDIQDPDNKKQAGSKDGVYDMPFVTIENVDRVDATHIIIGNDNNLPFSAGRAVDKADNNEFSLLEVGEFLNAK